MKKKYNEITLKSYCLGIETSILQGSQEGPSVKGTGVQDTFIGARGNNGGGSIDTNNDASNW